MPGRPRQSTASGGGGTDATITFTDITTNNASTTKHGFLPKLSGNATDFLNGLGAWAVPGRIGEWVATQTLVSSATDITFASLTGNTDCTYVIHLRIIKNGVGVYPFSLQPNGANTNCHGSILFVNTGLASTAVTEYASDLTFLNTGSGDGSTECAFIKFMAKDGFIRMSEAIAIEYGGGKTYMSYSGGAWDDTTTDLTSLVLHCGTANGFKEGTMAVLYKMSNG